jgi:hypothetical protein
LGFFGEAPRWGRGAHLKRSGPGRRRHLKSTDAAGLRLKRMVKRRHKPISDSEIDHPRTSPPRPIGGLTTSITVQRSIARLDRRPCRCAHGMAAAIKKRPRVPVCAEGHRKLARLARGSADAIGEIDKIVTDSLPRDLSGSGYAKSRQISRVCTTMHSTNGDDDPHTGPPEPEVQNGTAEVLSAAHYLSPGGGMHDPCRAHERPGEGGGAHQDRRRLPATRLPIDLGSSQGPLEIGTPADDATRETTAGRLICIDPPCFRGMLHLWLSTPKQNGSRFRRSSALHSPFAQRIRALSGSTYLRRSDGCG